MMMFKSVRFPAAFGLCLLLAGTLPPPAFAQEESAEEEVEELVIIGTRAQPRSVMDSSVPIDVISGEDLIDQGASDMNFMLRTVIPSFHVNMQPGRDAAALQNPINLRGLAPDHTLVLLNGKRRHRGATITWISDGRSDGAQGPDISVIPGIALRQVEVLRDGAAAQYGSDAIAGVINFELKDDSEGAELDIRYGWYDEDSDEDKTRVSGNVGLPLTEHGFANVSFEYSEDSSTDRSVLRDDVRDMIAGGNEHIADPAHVWGSPDIDGNLKAIFNLGVDLDADRRIYAFGNYAEREVETGFFYREPEDEAGMFAITKNFPDDPYDHDNNPDTPLTTIYQLPLIYDRTAPGVNVANPKSDDVGKRACLQYVDSADDGITAAGLPPDLARLLADDDCFSYHEWFPGGFQPRFGGDVTDYSLVVGMKGMMDSIGNGLSYDISFSFGENEAEYFIYNTLNPSWGPDSPTSFDLGSYIQNEMSFNIDVSTMVDAGTASGNIAAGFEWREEEFEITLGERASWAEGLYIGNGSNNGSNGFGGFGPNAVGKWDRENIAAYLDIEVDVSPEWRVSGALRWEDFNDFGSESTAKISTRLQASDTVAVRASYGSGFRAPTPGQQNAYNISTVFDAETVEPLEVATVPSDSELAKRFGGRALEPEESDNFTVGAIFDLDALQITVDYFRIYVDDRIFLSDDIDIADETVVDFDTIRFFENDFDTETDGFDVVLTYSMSSDMGDTDFQVSYNRTETEVTESTNLSAGRIRWIEEGAPETRYGVTVNHSMNDWRLMLRYYRFGSWYSGYDGTNYDGYGLADIGVTYRLNNNFSFTLGSDNVLDETPDLSIRRDARGNRYPRFAPGGIDGRFIYARARMEF